MSRSQRKKKERRQTRGNRKPGKNIQNNTVAQYSCGSEGRNDKEAKSKGKSNTIARDSDGSEGRNEKQAKTKGKNNNTVAQDSSGSKGRNDKDAKTKGIHINTVSQDSRASKGRNVNDAKTEEINNTVARDPGGSEGQNDKKEKNKGKHNTVARDPGGSEGRNDKKEKNKGKNNNTIAQDSGRSKGQNGKDAKTKGINNNTVAQDCSASKGRNDKEAKTEEKNNTSGGSEGRNDPPQNNKKKGLVKFVITLIAVSICIIIAIPSNTSDDKISPHQTASDEPRLQPLEDDKLMSGNNKLPKVQDDNKRNKRSVLFLNDEWGTSKGGISSVNRQLALQAKDAGYAVYVTVLAPPSDEDKKDAEDNGIKLIIAETISDVDQNINLNMLNHAHQRYFSCLEIYMTNLEAIIGHVPITSEGALDISQTRFPKAKVYLFTHVIPQDTDFHRERSYKLGDIETKVDTIIQQAEEADLIFSVGPKVYRKFKNEFRGSQVNDDKHKEFIPIPDSSFFDLNLKPFATNDAYEILTVGRVSNVENLKGYDIVAAALGKVASKSTSLFMDGLLWRIRGISDNDKSLEYIKKHLKSVNGNLLEIYPMQYGTQKLVTQDIQKSRLFLMPSRTEPFGMVGSEAMAAGIPILVTANSGLADFLKEHFPKHMHDPMIVSNLGKSDIDTDADIDIWVNRITDVLFDKYNDTFDLARKVKDKLTEMKSHPRSQIFKDELKKLK